MVYLVLPILVSPSLAQLPVKTCDGCVGLSLVNWSKVLSESRKCWFNDKHHYLRTFKDQTVAAIHEELEKLVNTCNGLVADECKQNVQIVPCATITDNVDDETECYTNQIEMMAKIYQGQEACEGKILDPDQSSVVERVMSGVVHGWREVHTTC